MIATLECPLPVARWQSIQEHSNIETTSPEMLMLTMPQAQVVEASKAGCLALFMPESSHRPLRATSAALAKQKCTAYRIAEVFAMHFQPDYPVLTPRLKLRPFARADVDAVFAYRRREDVSQFLFDYPMTREECAEAVQHRIGQVAFEDEGDKLVLAVERRSGGPLIGEVSLIWRSAESQQGEIGYILHPDFRKQGFATEAGQALLDIGFAQFGLHRIIARCDARNTPSFQVMERLGMRREAHFRHHALVKGRWDEEFIYAVLADEWVAHSERLGSRQAFESRLSF